MDTIIDSNIIRRDLRLNDKGFEILVDYLIKTKSKLILPLIVVEEVKGLYARTLSERYEEYKKSFEKLKSTMIFDEVQNTINIDLEGDVGKYIEYLHRRLGTSDKNIIPYKNEYLPEIISRAINRKKPLDEKGQQFRDGILWLTILDHAETTTEKVVAFISDNPADFSGKDENKLDQKLQEEANNRGVEVKYYKTLNEFAKEHASTVEFITTQWIEENIDLNICEELFIANIGRSPEATILDQLEFDSRKRPTGHIERTDYINSSVLEYFVYEKRDGTILLNLEVHFELEYEIELEKKKDAYDSRWEYTYNTDPITGMQEMEMEYVPTYSYGTSYKTIYKNPEFIGVFIVTLKDKVIENYELEEWDWG